MTKDFFLQERKNLEEQNKSIFLKIKELESEYISYNSKFSLGEKIQSEDSRGNVVFSFVQSIFVECINGEIKYRLLKSKNDGTASLMEEYKHIYNLKKING